jgi:hypothetical protein
LGHWKSCKGGLRSFLVRSLLSECNEETSIGSRNRIKWSAPMRTISQGHSCDVTVFANGHDIIVRINSLRTPYPTIDVIETSREWLPTIPGRWTFSKGHFDRHFCTIAWIISLIEESRIRHCFTQPSVLWQKTGRKYARSQRRQWYRIPRVLRVAWIAFNKRWAIIWCLITAVVCKMRIVHKTCSR